MITYSEIDAINRYGSPEELQRLKDSCGALGEFIGTVSETLRSMAVGCGWKGRSLISFEQFEGDYLEYDAESVRYFSEGSLQGTIRLEHDGSLRMTGESWSHFRSMRAAVMEASEACLSEENLDRARQFTLCGNVRVCMFTNPETGRLYCNCLDIDEVKEAVAGEFPEAQILSNREFEGAYRAQRSVSRDRNQSDGAYIRPQFPLPVVYLFDGEDFSDIRMFTEGENWEQYRNNVDKVLETVREVNRSLGERAGLMGEDARSEYHYGHASYLFSGNNEDNFILVNNFGRDIVARLQVRSDGVLFFESMTGEPELVGMDSLKARLEGLVLSDDNILKARYDLRAGGYSLVNDPVQDELQARKAGKDKSSHPGIG